MTVYIVQELQWEYNDDWFLLSSEHAKVAYVSRTMAETAARQIEAEKRSELRGCNLASRFDWSLLCLQGPDVLLEKLISAGVSKPPTDEFIAATYSDHWWSIIWDRVPEETLWEWCDAIRFTDVVEVEIES
jgi:hypothetical protein